MRMLICSVALSCAMSPATAEEFPEEMVKAKCATEWPGDFFMQKGCLDLQREGWTSFPATVDGLPKDVGQGILKRCRQNWPSDFFMQQGCATMQVESWKSLNN